MSFMIEFWCPPNTDALLEAQLTACAKANGGRLDFREFGGIGNTSVCLTFDFETLEKAELAAQQLRRGGVHVEGPADYGP